MRVYCRGEQEQIPDKVFVLLFGVKRRKGPNFTEFLRAPSVSARPLTCYQIFLVLLTNKVSEKSTIQLTWMNSASLASFCFVERQPSKHAKC